MRTVAIENHWGLDRVKPLLINAGIFVAVGILAGLALRLLLRPPGPNATSAPAPSPEHSSPESNEPDAESLDR